ncbi:hypothetical protein BU16DRAFT_596099 [Lophium mytilinum]|uniref:Uncharacterized protein n=1 Tax=Lophium mytilinum TaxID=390894 RepID=A0A6A6QDV9_9PEZI|nr:hypothetical protein BU16DRAFT_596099 [Lophium mytilinum]
MLGDDFEPLRNDASPPSPASFSGFIPGFGYPFAILAIIILVTATYAHAHVLARWRSAMSRRMSDALFASKARLSATTLAILGLLACAFQLCRQLLRWLGAVAHAIADTFRYCDAILRCTTTAFFGFVPVASQRFRFLYQWPGKVSRRTVDALRCFKAKLSRKMKPKSHHSLPTCSRLVHAAHQDSSPEVSIWVPRSGRATQDDILNLGLDQDALDLLTHAKKAFGMFRDPTTVWREFRDHYIFVLFPAVKEVRRLRLINDLDAMLVHLKKQSLRRAERKARFQAEWAQRKADEVAESDAFWFQYYAPKPKVPPAPEENPPEGALSRGRNMRISRRKPQEFTKREELPAQHHGSGKESSDAKDAIKSKKISLERRHVEGASVLDQNSKIKSPQAQTPAAEPTKAHSIPEKVIQADIETPGRSKFRRLRRTQKRTPKTQPTAQKPVANAVIQDASVVVSESSYHSNIKPPDVNFTTKQDALFQQDAAVGFTLAEPCQVIQKHASESQIDNVNSARSTSDLIQWREPVSLDEDTESEHSDTETEDDDGVAEIVSTDIGWEIETRLAALLKCMGLPPSNPPPVSAAPPAVDTHALADVPNVPTSTASLSPVSNAVPTSSSHVTGVEESDESTAALDAEQSSQSIGPIIDFSTMSIGVSDDFQYPAVHRIFEREYVPSDEAEDPQPKIEEAAPTVMAPPKAPESPPASATTDQIVQTYAPSSVPSIPTISPIQTPDMSKHIAQHLNSSTAPPALPSLGLAQASIPAPYIGIPLPSNVASAAGVGGAPTAFGTPQNTYTQAPDLKTPAEDMDNARMVYADDDAGAALSNSQPDQDEGDSSSMFGLEGNAANADTNTQADGATTSLLSSESRPAGEQISGMQEPSNPPKHSDNYMDGFQFEGDTEMDAVQPPNEDLQMAESDGVAEPSPAGPQGPALPPLQTPGANAIFDSSPTRAEAPALSNYQWPFGKLGLPAQQNEADAHRAGPSVAQELPRGDRTQENQDMTDALTKDEDAPVFGQPPVQPQSIPETPASMEAVNMADASAKDEDSPRSSQYEHPPPPTSGMPAGMEAANMDDASTQEEDAPMSSQPQNQTQPTSEIPAGMETQPAFPNVVVPSASSDTILPAFQAASSYASSASSEPLQEKSTQRPSMSAGVTDRARMERRVDKGKARAVSPTRPNAFGLAPILEEEELEEAEAVDADSEDTIPQLEPFHIPGVVAEYLPVRQSRLEDIFEILDEANDRLHTGYSQNFLSIIARTMEREFSARWLNDSSVPMPISRSRYNGKIQEQISHLFQNTPSMDSDVLLEFLRNKAITVEDQDALKEAADPNNRNIAAPSSTALAPPPADPIVNLQVPPNHIEGIKFGEERIRRLTALFCALKKGNETYTTNFSKSRLIEWARSREEPLARQTLKSPESDRKDEYKKAMLQEYGGIEIGSRNYYLTIYSEFQAYLASHFDVKMILEQREEAEALDKALHEDSKATMEEDSGAQAQMLKDRKAQKESTEAKARPDQSPPSEDQSSTHDEDDDHELKHKSSDGQASADTDTPKRASTEQLAKRRVRPLKGQSSTGSAQPPAPPAIAPAPQPAQQATADDEDPEDYFADKYGDAEEFC